MEDSQIENPQIFSLTSESYLSGDSTTAYESIYGRCKCEFCSADSTTAAIDADSELDHTRKIKAAALQLQALPSSRLRKAARLVNGNDLPNHRNRGHRA